MLTDVEVNKYKEYRAVVSQFEYKKRIVPSGGFAALTGGGAFNFDSRNLPESQRLS
jgi:hypothetical protein